MIVAICPLDNAFDTQANVEAIGRQLAVAAREGASLACFPECALTGFKARGDLSHAHLDAALAALQAQVEHHRVAALVPSIELDAAGRPRNRARLFGADGRQRACFEKTGLTASEQLWFVAGTHPRQRHFMLDGRRFGLVFCREIEDPAGQYVCEPVDAVLWPSYWGHGDPFDWSTPGPHDAYARMRDRVRAWNAPLLLVNHRRPDSGGRVQNITVGGGSFAVAPDGRLLHPFEPHRAEPLFVQL